MANSNRSQGAWVIVTDTADIVVESSEIKALRVAVTQGGEHRFVKFGSTFTNVAKAAPAAAPATRKTKAAPTAQAEPEGSPQVPEPTGSDY